MKQHIVLANNSLNQVQAFGSPTGLPFSSEGSAERWASRMRKRRPNLDYVVLPITPMPEEIQD